MYVSVFTDRYIILLAWPCRHRCRPQKKVTNPLRVGYLFRIAGGRSARFGTHTHLGPTKARNQHVFVPEFNTWPHERPYLPPPWVREWRRRTVVNKKWQSGSCLYSPWLIKSCRGKRVWKSNNNPIFPCYDLNGFILLLKLIHHGWFLTNLLSYHNDTLKAHVFYFFTPDNTETFYG